MIIYLILLLVFQLAHQNNTNAAIAKQYLTAVTFSKCQSFLYQNIGSGLRAFVKCTQRLKSIRNSKVLLSSIFLSALSAFTYFFNTGNSFAWHQTNLEHSPVFYYMKAISGSLHTTISSCWRQMSMHKGAFLVVFHVQREIFCKV